jgi:putative spermidine/putrescine transport system ATP-binding protein
VVAGTDSSKGAADDFLDALEPVPVKEHGRDRGFRRLCRRLCAEIGLTSLRATPQSAATERGPLRAAGSLSAGESHRSPEEHVAGEQMTSSPQMPSPAAGRVATDPAPTGSDATRPAGTASDAPGSAAPVPAVPAVRLEAIHKHFGDTLAVAGIDLEIADGEFFSMLGPSGSGKTTTLRMIAGFEQPTSGRILLHGRDVVGEPPFDRDVNTVFQDYALFPHMDVGQNVGYALMVRRVPRADRDARVAAALRMVRLSDFEARRPSQLSGGQRQRVALARALVNRPRVLLLDEPLGALDLKLREEMQIELKAIQQQVGITFIYVTHDQEEALTMSDRLAVFNAGRIEQVGSPADVYERPTTSFVAGFVGTSNLLRSEVARAVIGSDGLYTIRPEKIRIGSPEATVAADEGSAAGRIRDVVYLGSDTRYIVALDAGGELVVTQQNLETSSMEVLAARDRAVRLTWKRRHVLALHSNPTEGDPGGTRRNA